MMELAAAVAAQRELAEALFDQLRRDGLDEPGVSRDPYGPGNSARTRRSPLPQITSA